MHKATLQCVVKKWASMVVEHPWQVGPGEGGGRRGGTGGELGGNWAMFVGDDRERGCRAEAFDVYDLICSIFSGFGVVIIEAEGWWSCGRGNLYEGCDRSAVRGEESF